MKEVITHNTLPGGTMRSRSTLLVVSAALFMVVLDNLIVTVALPSIREDLGASLESLEWTVNAYTLTFAVMLIPAAALGDRFGRRRVFLTGLGLFTVASALAALAPSTATLIAARALQGAGGAVVAPLSLTLLATAFPAEKRGAALGIWSGVSGLGVALGPLVGGAVVDALSWQWIFWINVPLGLLLLPVAARILGESRGPESRLDLPGMALVGAGLLGVVLGVVRGQSAGWTSPLVLGSLVAGVAALGAFVAWERRASAPMLPLELFRDRTFALTNVLGFVMFFGTFGSIFLITQLAQFVMGYEPFEAGLRMLVWTGATMLVAPIAGVLAERFGPRTFIAAGLALQGSALAWMAVVASADVTFGQLIVPFAMAGVGMALTFAPSAAAILGSVAPERAGQASGANNAIREVGGVFGVAVLASVFAGAGSYASAQAFVDGFVPAVAVGAVVVLAGAALALALPVRRRAGVPVPGGAVPVPAG
jgi:EmrB/QacA subfamily drug resistance transporter